jgi:aryl-alcohol dehydrogenase-like predicted oxidoreductase
MEHLLPHTEYYHIPFTTNGFHNMQYVQLGGSGLRVSKIGLGTWKYGYPETNDGSRVGEKEAFQIFDRAVELGVTHWDTANRYNDASGNSERLIGKWLKANPDQRRNVTIATKIFGGMDGVTPNHCRLSRTNILESTYACLARLQSDYIDLLYFHSYDDTCPVEESLAAIEDLVRMDRVRYFAVSNFTVDQLRYYQAASDSISMRTRAVAVQNQFDIINHELYQPGVLDYCAKNSISYVAFSPLARGFLTSRYLDKTKVGPGDRLYDEGTYDKDVTEEKVNKLQKLALLAGEWELEVSQLALAYMMTLPGMGPVIPAASRVGQLESNAQAGQINFTNEQLVKIKSVLGH